MSRFARLTSHGLLGLLLLAALSCRDRNVILAPERVDEAAVQAAAAEDPEPDLDALARYRPGYAPRGAQSGSAVIGPAGGALRVGDFEVVVPPGALDREQRIQIVQLPAAGKEQPAGANFLPHGLTFNVPVTLRVPLASTESAGSGDAHVLWWNRGSWEHMPTTVTADGRLETRTDHFSCWGVQRLRGLTIIGG